MRYYLSRRAVLKWLETPSVYHLGKDELYELDEDSFRFMKECGTGRGCSSIDSAFIDYCLEEGLLTPDKTGSDRAAPLQAPVPSLRYLELLVTDRCNLRCKHCYIDRQADKELGPELIRDILAEFEKMQGLRVLISGGEPLVHSRFSEINEMLPEFLLRKVLFTNGVLLTKGMIKSLKVDEVQVSIDGLAGSHDAVRGPGMYARAMQAINESLDAGIDVSVSTMVLTGNMREFDAMEQLFRNMGVKDWTVDVPCGAGRLGQNRELAVTPEEGGKLLGYGFGGGIHSSSLGFGCGLHLAAVTAAGGIAKCSFYSDRPIGTIDRGLRAGWSSLEHVQLRQLSCNCEYLEVCRGGCRYRAELLEGKGGKDRYRCKLYGIL